MIYKEIEEYLLNFSNSWLSYPFGEDSAVFKIGHDESGDGKMFALVYKNTKPLRVSLKCDEQLAQKLRADYETVLPGYNLNKKNWNTIICTGQVPDDELKSLMILSYNLVNGEEPKK